MAPIPIAEAVRTPVRTGPEGDGARRLGTRGGSRPGRVVGGMYADQRAATARLLAGMAEAVDAIRAARIEAVRRATWRGESA